MSISMDQKIINILMIFDKIKDTLKRFVGINRIQNRSTDKDIEREIEREIERQIDVKWRNDIQDEENYRKDKLIQILKNLRSNIKRDRNQLINSILSDLKPSDKSIPFFNYNTSSRDKKLYYELRGIYMELLIVNNVCTAPITDILGYDILDYHNQINFFYITPVTTYNGGKKQIRSKSTKNKTRKIQQKNEKTKSLKNK